MGEKRIAVKYLDNDVIEINGVKYSGDFFRSMCKPDEKAVYSIKQNSNGLIILQKYTAETMNEAISFLTR